jgi:cell wall-associated NlpC family hydrolase
VPSHALSTPLSASAPALSVETLSVETSAVETPVVTAKRRAPIQRLLALLTVVVAVAALGACTAPRSSTKGQQIANIARAQIGKPYAYGATGPNAFDCSGLVYFAHRQAGISIPRTSSSQLGAARPVAKSQARPGDVIFFGSYHVGIYVGGGQMVDAPNAGRRVTQRPMWTSAYTVGRFN